MLWGKFGSFAQGLALLLLFEIGHEELEFVNFALRGVCFGQIDILVS